MMCRFAVVGWLVWQLFFLFVLLLFVLCVFLGCVGLVSVGLFCFFCVCVVLKTPRFLLSPIFQHVE